jgi:hypothetical protein
MSGLMGAKLRLFFQNQELGVRAFLEELIAGSQSDDPTTDDDYVIHF